jgi:Mg2+/Co2+ transporter CorB
MDIPISWLVISLIVLIILSAFFSGSETGLIAVNKYRLKSLAKNGNKRAKLALKLLQDTDSLIGTILLGNNFVNILSASIATIIAIALFGESSVFIASIVLTIVILIFAETTPKTFAAKNPEKVSLFSVLILNILIKILTPLVWIIKHLAGLILRVFGIKKDKTEDKIELDELKMSIIDTKDNIADKYHQILLNIIDVQKVIVDDFMIPKTEFVGIELSELDEAIKIIQSGNHTRLVVYEKGEIIGILHMRKIANLYAQNNFNLESIRKVIVKPYFAPEGISLATQLEEFQRRKKRLGLVVDEYGDVKGMIALEDILEEIVGQFTSNTTEVISDILKQDDGSYLIDPSINLHKLNRTLKLNFKTNAKTLNGLILEQLQHIPKRDISIKIDNVIIEILQITDNNIKLVKLTIIAT